LSFFPGNFHFLQFRGQKRFREKFGTKNLRWRVVAIDEKGNVLSKTDTELIRIR